MARKTNTPESEDDMRPEYDLRKLKLIGRGIYAERFRQGTNLAQLVERDREAEREQSKDDDLRAQYDFSKMRIVKRGPARKRTPQEFGDPIHEANND